ncbi:NAD(P)/FAD-dependent oxidoreductase [Zongyangia hominis]|uniref:FAD-dependent protein C-terminal domain-containing protein n=1 Tax=Zongyangia hominis TaxID=2763677 RepID=A0A926I698_9FIRM|nr:hypothetical protein [Zongyangia hominis]MBC8569819.1 hypothetical protein [Zongyangia hominis]
MPIVISSVRIPAGEDTGAAVEKALSLLPVSRRQVRETYVMKTSLDARRREHMTLVCSVGVELGDAGLEERVAARAGNSQVVYKPRERLEVRFGNRKLRERPVIIGFGPAGMFAALLLARHGYRPVIYERGCEVERRVEAVERFWKTGELSENTNVQFGEGGAGTFSDGKLTTRISDSRCHFVLEELVSHGAPAEISKKAKPHIGTDKLRDVVKQIRQEIISLGGEIHFEKSLTGIDCRGGRLHALLIDNQPVQAQAAVLAIGHSARDTFFSLMEAGVFFEPKAFSVGVRIEHLQSEIDKALFGDYAGSPMVGVGEYQLSYRKGDRGVYTFCMCPGGTVVPAASQRDTVVTNGMSEFARDRENANAALVVSVDREDFGYRPQDPIAFQERLEKAAFRLGGGNYRAPVQTVGRFLEHKPGADFGRVEPSYALGVTPASLDELLPPAVTSLMREGLLQMDRRLRGFAASDAVLTGVETRTSSPVRITRGDQLESISVSGLYPCGEGAGYAGGIMSAAVDGIRVAQEIMGRYAPFV